MKKRFLAPLLLLLPLVWAWWFYPSAPSALTTGQTVVLAGQALAGSDTLFSAKVTVTLVGAPCWTSTDLMPPLSRVVYASASTGLWSVTLVGTDSISCAGGLKPTYTVRVEHSVLETSGQIIEYSGLAIPATNGATTQLRSIVAAQ